MQKKKNNQPAPTIETQQQVNGLHSSLRVVAPSMPFVIDTILLQLQYRGWPLAEVNHETHKADVTFYARFERQSQQALDELAADVQQALQDVDAAVTDFPAMTRQLEQLIDTSPQSVPDATSHQEELAFLKWLMEDNFLFLGYRAYHITPAAGKQKETMVQAAPKSGLGILRHASKSMSKSRKVSEIPPNLAAFVTSEAFITISKTLDKSRVHRYADMDYIGIKEFDKNGQICHEHRFVGLLTSQAYTMRARFVPIIGAKIKRILAKVHDDDEKSYRRRALENILETFPRDELFRLDTDELARIAQGILDIQERPQLRVFLSPRPQERAHTVFVYLPLERMNSNVRLKIQSLLMQKLDGESLDYQVRMGDAPLVRITIKIRQKAYHDSPYTEEQIQQMVEDVVMGWQDDLFAALTAADPANGLALFRKYVDTFNETYADQTTIVQAQADIAVLEDMAAHKTVRFHFIPGDAEKAPELRVFRPEKPLGLSDAMPFFDKMGLRIVKESAYALIAGDETRVWLHKFEIEPQTGQHLDEATRPIIEQALKHLWCQELETDWLDSLIVNAGLHIDQVIFLRALVGYVHQIELRFGMHSLQQTLVHHSNAACALAELFRARFDPEQGRQTSQKKQEEYKKHILSVLDSIDNADEDAMLRCMMNVILAMVRTNAWQRQSMSDPLVFKFDSGKIEKLPQPVPWKEIYIYSPDFEGVHLRGGPVARGGIRWSDRRSDLRTEILGLMKAQTTKNTVIVPVGAKGGFVIKKPVPATRDERMACGEYYYRQFIQGLLSVTDNRVEGCIKSPHHVVRYDEDDPYLVVAADKGTATFSDFANDEARQAGFWLDDAFASGGSQGYDHKEMGITARGAWESVRQHFLKKEIDVQQDAISVIGIGDMAGDVFGNGMLCSDKIKLIAAFNHMHIFVDPTPEPAISFKERQRLFKLPHSTWQDYDKKCLSAGGAVFERRAKKITLTPEIKTLLDIPHAEVTPDELIQFILKAEADLLWNGGIGTYIKASDESHALVADRANDAVRINATDLRVACIAEGGNLGLTQQARIEFALAGGAVNTDALDNSAGVDTSDHEVNIKILLREVQNHKNISEKQRNKLLASLQEDVADHVLQTNRYQNLAISLKERQGQNATETLLRLQHTLARRGILDAKLEFLPDEEVLQDRQRRHQGYTRPELCVLLAYAKMDINQALLASELPEEPALDEWLFSYFPTKLEKYKHNIQQHPLRRELIATLITNQVVNFMGPTFVNRLREETGHKTDAIVKAYLLARDIHATDEKWADLFSQGALMPFNTMLPLFEELKQVTEQTTLWLLHTGVLLKNIGENRSTWTKPARVLEAKMPSALRGKYQQHHKKQVKAYTSMGMPADKADLISMWPYHIYLPQMIKLLEEPATNNTPEKLAALFFCVLDRLNIFALQQAIGNLSCQDNWQRLSRVNLQQDLLHTLQHIVRDVLHHTTKNEDASKALQNWLRQKDILVQQHDNHMRQLQGAESVSLAMVNVIQAHLRQLS